MRTSVLAIASFLAASVSAHGNITSPPARKDGPAMATLCGAGAVAAVQADGTIPIEDLGPVSAGCNAFLCRGAQFEDNANNVQQLKAGQVVKFKAAIPIAHKGPMNVSIVDTKANKIIGEPLISFAVYADEAAKPLPANNTDFSVTMPNSTAGACAEAGKCVLQWFWLGTQAKQTYESCVDFVMP